MARPTDYTPELASKICSRLAQGISLRTVCKDDDMPSVVTVFNWFPKYPEFLNQYACAKQESADAMAEEILDLSDEALPLAQNADPKASNAIVQASRLRVDTRKWLMSKMKPKKYGDKLDMTSDGKALPTPLLYAIRNNNSNKEDSGTNKAN